MRKPLARRDVLFAVMFIAVLPAALGIGLLAQDFRKQRKESAQLALRLAEDLAQAQASDAWDRYDDSLAACERGRDTRKRLNAVSEGVEAALVITAAFLGTSATLRQQIGTPEQAQEAVRARDRLLNLEKELGPPLELLNCKTLIRPPLVPDPRSKE